MKSTSPSESNAPSTSRRRQWLGAILLVGVLPWLAQPPVGFWPAIFVALLPLLWIADQERLSRRRLASLLAISAAYWAMTLQGLRHANPLIYPCWLALAGYLGIYPLLFVLLLRRIRKWLPVEAAAPLVWVGTECVRNYLLTGISTNMLGHALADVPMMIQIADLGGTYAVSAVIVTVNVALYQCCRMCRTPAKAIPSVLLMALLVGSTLFYGRHRLAEPVAISETTFALIARNEPVEYVQNEAREVELFQAYARQTEEAIRQSDEVIDAVVWPESMFTAGKPWLAGDGSAAIGAEQGLTAEEVTRSLDARRLEFESRAGSLQSWLAASNGDERMPPDLLVGCGVIEYGETATAYSGLVHVSGNGRVTDWYGKNHLVMFGEYIPLVRSIPGIRSLVPGNMGLTAGDGPVPMEVGDCRVCPNICIETAVERVPLNHLRTLLGNDQPLPSAIVTVTNDGWFDDSSVIQHHKRCAQLVAVACRRDVLSAANNGPTVWIDSCGRVVEELSQGTAGAIIAKPNADSRVSLAVRIGDWPARLCVLLSLVLCLVQPRSQSKDDDDSGT